MTCDSMLDEKIFRWLNDGLFEELIDRGSAGVPDTFVPSAKSMAVVGDKLWFLVDPRPLYTKNPPRSWVSPLHKDLFRNVGINDYFLRVPPIPRKLGRFR